MRVRGAQELRCFREGEKKRLQPPNAFLNPLQADSTSGALRIAETTQMRRAPAASTSWTLPRWIPPMANQGLDTCAAAQRTYSRFVGSALGLVPVANTGPIAI